MPSAPFPTEDIFQALLEKHPALLTSSTFGEVEPRRWLLVRREMPVGDAVDNAGRWSLDHLFLDQDGVPTLVEIKRATDTRSRREVVAQMLDYAANAVSWWRVTELREFLRASFVKEGKSEDEGFVDLIGAGADVEAYWRTVQANLSSGRIRLLFVADVVHPELQRIVEFLNEQMRPAVVLALELRPFGDGERRIISPRVIGLTDRARGTKSVSDGPPRLSYEDWLASALVAPAPLIEQARRFAALLEAHADRLAVSPSQTLCAGAGGKPYNAFYIKRNGKPSAGLFAVKSSQAFASVEARQDFLHMLLAAGVQLSRFDVEGEPTITLPPLQNGEGWSRLEGVVKAVFQSLRLNKLQLETHQ